MMYSANLLREKVELLELVETAEGWEWKKTGEAWAGVELTGKTCIFSKLGIGAHAAEITLRSRALTLHQAMRWRGQHLFLSEITEPERGWLNVQAAAVELVMCKGREDGKTFPGVLTEKYLRHEQLEPMAAVTSVYVLVMPKVIELKRGGLISVKGEAYQVLVCHELDTFKNEYEIKNVKEL